MKKYTLFPARLLKVFVIVILFFCFKGLKAQSNEDCMMCHEDPELVSERNGKTALMFVDTNIVARSVHKSVRCIECHNDVNTDEYLHSDQLKKLQPVECGSCHKTTEMQFNTGIHGQALKLNEPYAPDCKECHGTHDILSRWNSDSKIYKMNIPALCGNCHKEGAPVARIYNIDEHNIIENYSQGIHGKGLFQSGLLVTATCNDCHNSHLILPHESPNSSVNPKRIARTCMKCHVQIEKTHKKVIKSELWEKAPGAVPSCTDCHPPHKVEYQNIEDVIPNKSCLKCHLKDESKGEYLVSDKGDTLHFDLAHLSNSVHSTIQCVKCHTGVSHELETPCQTVDKVDCSNCHIEVSNEYFSSGHGQAYFQKVEGAPYCTDCHGTHETKSRFDDTSPTYRGAIPTLCGGCHKTNGKANIAAKLKEVNAYFDYSTSIHGKGLTKKGLLVSAVCTDCHTSHHELKESDTLSSVNPKNVPSTCAKCHKSIYDKYSNSEHSIESNTGELIYPTCSTCHPAHFITEIDQDKFMTEITIQCGMCHEKLSSTYKDTYHGKAYLLGDLDAARCSDCHGAHKILKVDNPNSMVGYKNIVNTCKKCHPNANTEFTGYLTHATHNDNPVLFWSFWGMTTLLLVVFGFFGLHTLIWLPRSLKQRKINKHVTPVGKTKYYRRFNKRQRFTHILVILSFLLLALTGMTLKFAHMEWASWFAYLLGGVKSAGTIHRFAAVITFGYFAFHLSTLFQLRAKEGISAKEFLFGNNSLMFNKQDLKDIGASIKWFLGKGPRPEYGRWTYWEKFDYFAVFWGVAIIGMSGLILWFPEFFTNFIPGWAINVAQIIHSDEALLATGFIFTIHFFNTHLRPESFPMDTVIFTGHVPLEEYKKDRPREYKELVKSGRLDKVVVEKEMSPSWIKTVRFFGFLFLSLGIIMVILIIYSLIAGVY
ncbi:MAG: cytochrome b/b6 domain-containing protein [Bacteroidales bacterium]|nr:cytochrome b/b6 domain-containing protein [Bacteroidales bacterium]